MIYELIHSFISMKINESFHNQQYWVQLPYEQQQVLDEILDEIHDIAIGINKIESNERKVMPEYIPQFKDAMLLKFATELGMMNGGR